MSADYLAMLDTAALGILAETTGVAPHGDAERFFAERPNGIRIALQSEAAAGLLDAPTDQVGLEHRRLLIAIAVHQTAERICSAGWSARDESPIDLDLLSFAGQGDHQAFMVDLLAAHLTAEPSSQWLDLADHDLAASAAPAAPGSPERLDALLDLCHDVAEIERAGALRLLGDEALFVCGIAPAQAAQTPITAARLGEIKDVLPPAIQGVLDDLAPHLRTQLDLYLEFGPIWYRMASRNLLQRPMRRALDQMANEFSTARRFLVRVSQGQLAPIQDQLFAVTDLV